MFARLGELRELSQAWYQVLQWDVFLGMCGALSLVVLGVVPRARGGFESVPPSQGAGQSPWPLGQPPSPSVPRCLAQRCQPNFWGENGHRVSRPVGVLGKVVSGAGL